MSKFLDNTGVSYLMGLIKTAISNKKASVTDNNPSLSWGTKSKVGTVDGVDLNVTMPANPNTDTKVTSAANHYTPSKDNSATKTASGATGTAGSTVQVITAIETDGKGHVTGIVAGAATDTRDVTSVNGKTGAVSLSASDVSAIPASEKGVANGVASLGSDGKVPAAQLPSYVDDVIELLNVTNTAPSTCVKGDMYYNTTSKKIFTATAANTWGTTGADGEAGKIYVNLNNGKTYRWSGTDMAVISETLALGETSSTAYRGDRGKIAYDHSQSTHARTDATKTEGSTTNGNIKINDTETNVYTHPAYTAAAAAAKKVGLDATGHVVLGDALTKNDIGLGNVANQTITVTNTSVSDGTNTFNKYVHPGSGTNPHGTTKSDVGLGSVVNTGDSATPVENGTTKFTTGGAYTELAKKVDKTDGVTGVSYDTTNKKIQKTINGTTTDVVTASTIVTDGGGIKSHQTIKQDGVTGATGNHYAVCSVAAGTAAKTADITAGTPTLEAGLRVVVKFNNANTAASPTLNINGKGAKAIWYDGAAITTDNAAKALISGVCEFIYDGTQWHLINKMAALTNDDIDTLWTAA